jgi:hypothetical protein
MKRFISIVALLSLISGCSTLQKKESDAATKVAHSGDELAHFSENSAGGLPNNWVPMVVFRNRKKTEYQLVADGDKTVLHAYAAGATSGLMENVSIDPNAQPWINWKWKIGSQAKSIDNSQRPTEDSPVRIILGFDGDKDSLPFSEQILFDTAKLLTGYEFPYATLMYIWDPKASVGSVKKSKRSSRIRTMVVENGLNTVDQWRDFTRNIVEDFQKAYGEKPGKLIGVGVLTDTDEPDETVEAWYGDIRLLRNVNKLGMSSNKTDDGYVSTASKQQQ